MRLVEFVRARIGQRVTAPGGLGGECVDLANLYLGEVLGREPIRANAVNWSQWRPAGLRWVPNTLINYPLPGDVPVWREASGAGIGPDGHVAIAVLADANSLLTFDQNWPPHAPCSLVCHRSYLGVAGWFTPLPG